MGILDDMVQIPRSEYEEFLRSRGGGVAGMDSPKKPAGGWKFYRPGTNPFAVGSLNITAQSEVITHDLDLAVRLAEQSGAADHIRTLREMQKREILKSHGY